MNKKLIAVLAVGTLMLTACADSDKSSEKSSSTASGTSSSGSAENTVSNELAEKLWAKAPKELIEEYSDEAFAQKPAYTEHVKSFDANGNVSSENEGYSAFNSHGNFIGTVTSPDADKLEQNSVYFYLYDKNDENVVLEAYFHNENNECYVTYSVFTYNEHGDMDEARRYSPNASTLLSYEYTYDDNGNKLSEKESENGEVTYTYTFTYDENGNTSTKLTESNDDTSELTEYTYDDNNKLISSKTSDPNDPSAAVKTSEYDENGLVKTMRVSSGEDKPFIKHYYEYDAKQRVTEKRITTVSDGNETVKSSTTYTYNDLQ